MTSKKKKKIYIVINNKAASLVCDESKNNAVNYVYQNSSTCNSSRDSSRNLSTFCFSRTESIRIPCNEENDILNWYLETDPKANSSPFDKVAEVKPYMCSDWCKCCNIKQKINAKYF